MFNASLETIFKHIDMMLARQISFTKGLTNLFYLRNFFLRNYLVIQFNEKSHPLEAL